MIHVSGGGQNLGDTELGAFAKSGAMPAVEFIGVTGDAAQWHLQVVRHGVGEFLEVLVSAPKHLLGSSELFGGVLQVGVERDHPGVGLGKLAIDAGQFLVELTRVNRELTETNTGVVAL